MDSVSAFFIDIDHSWKRQREGKVRLRLIGSGALILQTDYQRGTKDSDVFESADLATDTRMQLLALAGRGTALYHRHRMFVEIVPNGLPFLPHVPSWCDQSHLNAALTHLELAALSVVDVIVSKMKRFSVTDERDIDAMIDRDLVSHDDLIARFRAAVDEFTGDARAPDLRKYIANLHRVERDMFRLPETEIQLPSWI